MTLPLERPADIDSILHHETPRPGVISAFVASKIPGRPSEDILVITPHHVAVFDGMSSPLRSAGQRASGRDFALAAANAVLTLDRDCSAQDAARLITHATSAIRSEHAGPYGAVGAIYSDASHEIWRVGDVNVQIGADGYPGRKRVDDVFTEFRAAVNHAALRAGTSIDDVVTQDPGRTAAESLLAVQSGFANSPGPFGYGVFNGNPIPEQFIEIVPVPRGARVTIASDGYPSIRSTLGRTEDRLRSAIRSDPACIGVLRAMGKPVHPGADAPDDRTFVQFVTD